MMEQGSSEWYKFRSVRLTASRFGDVLARSNTKRYQGYFEDRIDMLLGAPYFQDEKPWFAHGKAWEPLARGLYEWKTGLDVPPYGAIAHPDYDFISCSPDGKRVEFKSHKSYKQFTASEKKFPTNHKPQVQGTLWITKWEWIDFVSFFKNDETTLIHIRRIEPDLKYFKRLETACLKMWSEIQNEIAAKGALCD